MTNPGVPAMTVGVYGIGMLIGQEAGAAVGLENILLQTGGVGLALVTGVWLLRRYDARSDAAQSRADKLLREERDAHQQTLRMLGEERALRIAAENELRRRLNLREDPTRDDRRQH